MTAPAPYDLDIDLPTSGSTANYLRLAEVLGTTSLRIDTQGCDAEVRDLLAGRAADPLSCREMRKADLVRCCPVAYAIARHAGYDPAAILLLERLSCLVEVIHPHWTDRLTAYSDGIRDGFTHMRLRAPMARGVVWHSAPTNSSSTRIRIDTALSGLPDTVFIGLHERMLGAPLSNLISHPVTDPLGLVIAAVVDPGTGDGMLVVHLHPVPEPVGLDEAVGRWAEHAAGD